MIERLSRWATRHRLNVYGGAIAVVMVTGWLYTLLRRDGAEPTDFMSFYTAATHLASGNAAALYDVAAQVDAHHALSSEKMVAPYLNPPGLAALFIPLTYVSYPAALAIWRVVCAACWVAGLVVLRRALPGLQRYSVAATIGSTVLFFPVLLSFFYAQNTALWFLLLAISVACLFRGREVCGGAVLGLLALKPQLALGLGFALVLKGRWRALIGGGLTVGLIAFAHYAWLPDATAAYLDASPYLLAFVTGTQETAAFSADVRFPVWGLHHLYAFWWLLTGDATWTTWLTGVATALFVVAGARMLRATPWQPGSHDGSIVLAVTLAMGWLCGLHLFHYDLALLLVSFLLVLAAAPETLAPGRSLRGWSALVFIACFVGIYATGFAYRGLQSLDIQGGVIQWTTLAVTGWCIAAAQSRLRT